MLWSRFLEFHVEKTIAEDLGAGLGADLRVSRK